MAVQAEVKSGQVEKKKSKKNPESEAAPTFKTPFPPASPDETSENKTALVKLEDEQMDEAVKAFKKLLEINSTEKKADLFSDASGEGTKVQLHIAGIKLPRVSEAQILKLRLPHPHTPESRDVCLIVKDMEKGIRPDHENTVRHYENLLAEKGVQGITKVMALRELKVEYKTFESKTALCHLYDHFLADDRIIRFLPQFLGKAFYKRKKYPLQVSLTVPNLAKEISRALHTVTLPLKHAGPSSTVTLGLSTTSDLHLKENLTSVVRALETKYPGGWVNVRSMHLLSSNCSLPLYMTMRATHEVGMVRGLKRKSRGLVVDELSTVVGATVTVTPTGNVRVKRTKDPMWMEDEDTAQELTNEVAEGDAEEGAKEKKQEKKQEKAKKKMKAEDDDSEDEMEDKEMAYMQKVADEEEEMEKKLEASEDKLEEKFKSSQKEPESGSEDEEDVADDDAEAENLLSEGDDSDSEEELVMKNAGFEDDDDDEEGTPAKKPKKTKKNKVKSADKSKSPKEQPKTKQSLKQKKFVEQKKKAKLGKGKK